MVILALETDVPGSSEEAMRPYLKAEAARVWELYQAGVLRELYFRQERASAVFILEAADASEAAGALATLPLVRKGMITFSIIPLVPYPGFARLFADEA